MWIQNVFCVKEKLLLTFKERKKKQQTVSIHTVHVDASVLKEWHHMKDKVCYIYCIMSRKEGGPVHTETEIIYSRRLTAASPIRHISLKTECTSALVHPPHTSNHLVSVCEVLC